MERKDGLDISHIQRFSVDDGPGIRTTVFLKGCNLKCRWCHNPENITHKPVLQFKKESCIRCGNCLGVCKSKVHQKKGQEHILNRELCQACGMCVQACPQRALTIAGHREHAEQLLAMILKDKDYYDTSGGGVTFSGGEPLLQHQGLLQMLRLCKEKGLHTAVDTAGAVPYRYFEKVLPYTDVFLYDLKCISGGLHQKYTGIDNKEILSNLKRLSEEDVDIIIRTPLIEGVNTDEKEIKTLAEFVSGLKKVKLYELLPYHDYGIGKYGLLGMETEQDGFCAPSEEKMEVIFQIMQNCNICPIDK